METLTIPGDTTVKLQVSISSEAIVATNVSLNDGILKRSKQYKFNVELGNTNKIENKEFSIVTSCFLNNASINQVFDNTQADFTLEYDQKSQKIKVEKQKITNTFFIIYGVIKILKS